MIDRIKEDMQSHIGDHIRIIFNGGRNRHEEYEATLKEVYNYVFIVQLQNDINEIKSFTYSDILTQTIKIYYE